MDRYLALTVDTISPRLGAVAALRARLGADPSLWRAREVGDGNLNLVFIVEGPAGALVLKQALPYVRLVGESWPLPLKRSYFEYHALVRQDRRDPGRSPKLLHFDEAQALIAMEFLTPHVILRRSLEAGVVHADLGAQLGQFLARTMFRGSDLSMPTAERKADLALFAGNVELCDITEALVFTDPYYPAKLNRHTSPQLDQIVAQLRADIDLKVAAQRLKLAFCSRAETLLHGDLHTGSVMVFEGEARVIDPEFATYGPFGFDVGMLMANFFMAFFAQRGFEDRPGARDPYRTWILEVATTIWKVFADEFARLWRTERHGVLYRRELFEDQGQELASEQGLSELLNAIWRDACGFAGVEMHRRILGLAHIAEFERIADPDRRANAEAKALRLGRFLAVNGRDGPSLAFVLDLARRLDGDATA